MSTIDPDSVAAQSLSADEFVAMALANLERGYAPLPIGKRDKRGRFKAPWVSGYHGYERKTATLDEFSAWPALVESMIQDGTAGVLSLGLVLPPDVVGFDVDAYDDKPGHDTLKTWRRQWGKLPKTYIVTARFDGSGIRLYRKPDGWEPQEQSNSGVDFIDSNHRYVAAPPSYHHTGQRYRLRSPRGEEANSGVLPSCDDLPPLPKLYRDGLARATKAVRGPSVVLADFIAAHATATRPRTLPGITSLYAKVYEKAGEPHNAAKAALDMGFSDAAVGYLSAADVYDAVRTEWAKTRRPLKELEELAAWTATKAANQDRAITLAKATRDYGTDTRKGQLNMDDESVFDDARPARALSTIKPTPVRWLWYGWLPLGKVSILEGESDVGKSTLTIAMASIVSQGKPWPTTVLAGGKHVESMSDPSNVLLVGIEDDDSDTVVPRLMAAGADLDRVFKLERQTDANGDLVPFTIPRDVDWLRRAILDANATLVVIDPISACMPEGTKHGVDSEIRRVLMHIVDLAAETRCAILLVRHFNKAQGMSAKNRGGGSVAYGALVRSVIQAGPLTKKTDDGATYALARAIGNLSKSPESIGYSLESAPDDEEVPIVMWRGHIDLTADQLVGADNAKVGDSRKNAPMRNAAKQAIREMLRAGPVAVKTVIDKVKLNLGCSEGTIQKAAKELGVIRATVYDAKGEIDYWTWELTPEQKMIRD